MMAQNIPRRRTSPCGASGRWAGPGSGKKNNDSPGDERGQAGESSGEANKRISLLGPFP